MIRDERYKFVWNPTDIDELYDLQNDPWELTNLATTEAHGETLSEYRRRLYDQFAELGDPMVTGLWMTYRLGVEG
jgi:arylsulfatase A-like enzyme